MIAKLKEKLNECEKEIENNEEKESKEIEEAKTEIENGWIFNAKSTTTFFTNKHLILDDFT